MSKISQLTGLRYVAAVAVFLSHLGLSKETLVGQVLSQGFIGVSFFFVLSGFVLSYAYTAKIVTKEISFWRYIALRVGRIAPLHYLTALPFVWMTFALDWHFVMVTAANLLLIQSWIPSSEFYFSLNAPSWSLSNEMFFYICFFFLAGLSTWRLAAVSFAILTLVSASAFIAYIFLSDMTIYGNQPLIHWIFYILPVSRILEFLCGVIIHRLWSGYSINFRPRMTFIFLVIIFQAAFAHLVAEPFLYSLYYFPATILLLWSALYAVGIEKYLLSSRLTVLLGNASFAFYLIHIPMLMIMRKEAVLGWMFMGSAAEKAAFSLISLFIISAVSIFLHLVFEEPLLTRLRQVVFPRLKANRL